MISDKRIKEMASEIAVDYDGGLFYEWYQAVQDGIKAAIKELGEQPTGHSLPTHGLSGTLQYKAWARIKSKCINPKDSNYQRYGARGIKMWDEWMNNPGSFCEYIMSLPNAFKEGYTIDREDNDGDYVPGNVRWATWHQQSANQRRSVKNKSGYTGVFYHKRDKAWISKIVVKNKDVYLGYHGSPRDAAIARDQYIIDNELWEYPLQVLTNHSNNVT